MNAPPGMPQQPPPAPPELAPAPALSPNTQLIPAPTAKAFAPEPDDTYLASLHSQAKQPVGTDDKQRQVMMQALKVVKDKKKRLALKSAIDLVLPDEHDEDDAEAELKRNKELAAKRLEIGGKQQRRPRKNKTAPDLESSGRPEKKARTDSDPVTCSVCKVKNPLNAVGHTKRSKTCPSKRAGVRKQRPTHLVTIDLHWTPCCRCPAPHKTVLPAVGTPEVRASAATVTATAAAAAAAAVVAAVVATATRRQQRPQPQPRRQNRLSRRSHSIERVEDWFRARGCLGGGLDRQHLRKRVCVFLLNREAAGYPVHTSCAHNDRA